jgi:hypothetical protein
MGTAKLLSKAGVSTSAALIRRRWPQILGALAVFVLGSDRAAAQLMVYPTRLVLESNQRSGQLEIVNNSSRTVTYRITLVNRRMDENGRFMAAESAAAGELFADGMLSYSPRRVTLAAGAGQVIRLMTRKPADLAAGEYRSHLLFSEQAEPTGQNSAQPPAEGAADIGVSLTALVGISIPVIMRVGETAATVTLGNLALSSAAADQQASLAVDVQRSGTQSCYGDLSASFTPAGGVALVIGRVNGVAVYTPNALRHVTIPLSLPAGTALANGTVTVSYRERPEHRGAPAVEASLSLP